jgi:hypothetical protein
VHSGLRKVIDAPEITVEYQGPDGTVTASGGVYQAWRQLNQWHVRRVGDTFPDLESALTALRES